MADQVQATEVPQNQEENLELTIKADMEGQMQEIENHLNLEERDEAKIFIDEFAKYDTEKKGIITVDDLYLIIQTLEKDVRILDSILSKLQKNRGDSISLNEYQNIITEMGQLVVESVTQEPEQRDTVSAGNMLHENQRIIISIDQKVIDAIRVLYAHQKRCEVEGRYGDAQQAKDKIEQIKTKEIERHQNNVKTYQEQELLHVENAQKQQFVEFTKTWDEYMREFDFAAQDSLNKLREKHEKELDDGRETLLKKDEKIVYKQSSKLLELRNKEKNLVKQKRYKSAEKIKAAADDIEEYERGFRYQQLGDNVEKKLDALRLQHQRAVDALVKKIQKEKVQQTKNRQDDSQRLLVKTKSLRNELIKKHATELENVSEKLRANLTLLHSGEPTLDIKSLTSCTTTRRIPSPQPKNTIKSPFKFSFKDEIFSPDRTQELGSTTKPPAFLGSSPVVTTSNPNFAFDKENEAPNNVVPVESEEIKKPVVVEESITKQAENEDEGNVVEGEIANEGGAQKLVEASSE